MTILWLFAQLLGWSGAGLIGYSIAATYSESWRPLEHALSYGSSLLTIIGTVLTAALVYLPPTASRPAWPVSRRYLAPVVILGGVIAIYFLLRTGSVPQATITGFSLLAIAGGISRVLPKDVPGFSN